MNDDLTARLITASDEYIADPAHDSADSAPVLLREAADEILRLRAWKAEATVVLNEWDTVAARSLDGVEHLGQSKAWIVGVELGRLEAENARLRAELDRITPVLNYLLDGN